MVKEMKTKKKKQVKKNHLTSDGQLCLTRTHLLEIELLRSKHQAEIFFAQARNAQADKVEVDAILQVRALRQEAAAAGRRALEFSDDSKLLFNRLGPEYGIDFRKSTYDDETGIIQVSDDEIKECREVEEKSPEQSG